ncbi:glycoside hydrolase superfamily, partial [Ochromonadaceae sp. CCMP2298]
DYWYLNIATNTWQHVYSYEPYAGLTSAQQQLIRGGEIALWGEYVDDVNLLTSLFPRLCVGAERLWSAQYVTDETAALQRLMAQRCRLLNRGTASSPIQPGDYCDVTYV